MPSPQQTGAVHEAHASSSGPALHEANRESFHSPKGVSQPLPPSSPAAPGRESPHREPVPITGRKHGEIRTVPDSSFHLSVKLRVQSLRPLVTVRSLPRSGKVLTEQPQSADKTAEFTCAKSSSRARHPAPARRHGFPRQRLPRATGRWARRGPRTPPQLSRGGYIKKRFALSVRGPASHSSVREPVLPEPPGEEPQTPPAPPARLLRAVLTRPGRAGPLRGRRRHLSGRAAPAAEQRCLPRRRSHVASPDFGCHVTAGPGGGAGRGRSSEGREGGSWAGRCEAAKTTKINTK